MWAELECKNQHVVINYANTSFGKKKNLSFFFFFFFWKNMGDDVTLVQCPFKNVYIEIQNRVSYI